MRDRKPICRRAILKLSGEALAGEPGFGLDFAIMDRVCEAVKTCLAMGVEIGIMVGRRQFLARSKKRQRDDGAHPRRLHGDAGDGHELPGTGRRL